MKQNILLTGDDGYNSIGIRLLIHVLRDSYDLRVAGTKVQQSGVGGKITLQGGEFREVSVDGISGIFVDGSPVDAIACASVYYKKSFDWVISGVNLGVNIGGHTISSGTFAAAYFSLFYGLASRAMGISLDIEPQFHGYNHNGTDSLLKYIQYPGVTLSKLLQKLFSQTWFAAPLYNVNIPRREKYNGKALLTSLFWESKEYWGRPIIDLKNAHFQYPRGDHSSDAGDCYSDAGAIARGYISVSPLFPQMNPCGKFQKFKERIVSL